MTSVRCGVTVARVTLELTSPMSIGAGVGDAYGDAHVITDANGLPTIPGSTIAGVARAAWKASCGYDEAVFGKAGTRQDEDDGMDSIVSFSFGHIHGSDDRPVQARIDQELSDPLLCVARAPITRNHVRIEERGVAADRGLYDRDMIPAGHRFTFEVSCHCASREASEATLERVLGLLASPHACFGARSRIGLGQFELRRVRLRSFDLKDRNDFDAFAALPVALWQPDDVLVDVDLARFSPPEVQGRCTLELELEARQGWQIGGGLPTEADCRQSAEGPRVANLVPFREARVHWRDGQGSYDPTGVEPAAPGSSIKGALRHRTTFYYNALSEVFADTLTEDELVAHGAARNRQVWELFGGLEPNTDERPMLGRVTVEDATIKTPGALGFQDHVTLDRFTGGAFGGHLFDEAFYWKGRWVVRIHIDDRNDEVPAALRQALAKALDDLKAGRLQIGAGDARGHGRFKVREHRWSDDGRWLAGKPKEATSR